MSGFYLLMAGFYQGFFITETSLQKVSPLQCIFLLILIPRGHRFAQCHFAILIYIVALEAKNDMSGRVLPGSLFQIIPPFPDRYYYHISNSVNNTQFLKNFLVWFLNSLSKLLIFPTVFFYRRHA